MRSIFKWFGIILVFMAIFGIGYLQGLKQNQVNLKGCETSAADINKDARECELKVQYYKQILDQLADKYYLILKEQ